MIMSLGQEKLCPQNARLDISAPMPLAILPGLVGIPAPMTKIEVREPDGSCSYPPVPSYPTLIPILVYKWYADNRPYLWDEECDRRWVSAGPSDDFQSIQIYASSCVPENVSHAEAAFTAAAKLLGADAHIHPGDGPVQLIPGTPPAGLSWAQVNLFFDCVVKIGPCNPILRRDFLDFADPCLTSTCSNVNNKSGPSSNCGPITGGGHGG
jgi:hypothetical protein